MARNQSAALTIKTEYLNERLLLQRGRRSFFTCRQKNLKILREYPKKIRQIESERRNLQSQKIIENTPSNATPFLRVSEGRFEVIQFTLPNPQVILG